jgi:DNA repair protein RadC
MGERSLTLLDDMSNWGLRKLLLAEVDVFQIDHTHELYAHMNINYVRAPKLPSFENYGELLKTMQKGDFFISTGEVLMPQHSIRETRTGTLSASLVHPREVFRDAIRHSASSVVLAHNHPSGDPEPSEEDLRITRRLVDAGRIIGIDVLDHIIIGKETFRSFKEKGLI